MINENELEILREDFKRLSFKKNNQELWQKAFHEYNTDNKLLKPLSMNCMPCFIKVYEYLHKKNILK